MFGLNIKIVELGESSQVSLLGQLFKEVFMTALSYWDSFSGATLAQDL